MPRPLPLLKYYYALGIVTAATLKTVPALIDRCVAWAGVDTPQQAYALFQFLNARESRALEGFEILPDSCLGSVLRHIPDTKSPLESSNGWHVLVEFVRDNPDQADPAAVAEKLLAEAIDQELITDG